MGLQGFFQIQSVKPKRDKLLDMRYNQPGEPDCRSCGLDKQGCKNPKVPPSGEGKKGILIIAEAQGGTEDTLNRNLVGEVGQFLEKSLKPRVNLHKDCLIVNSVNCRPPKNRTPTDNEIMFCKPYVLQTIKDFKPKHIWLFGNCAIQSFIGDRFKNKTISRWADITFPDKDTGAWVTSLYHPSYITRNSKDEHLQAFWKRSISNAIFRTNWAPYEFPDFESQVTILKDSKRVIFLLQRLLRTKPEITIDYETTGRKPYKIGHKIYCVSIDDGDRSYVFPLQRPGAWTKEEWIEISSLYKQVLEDPEILKTAQGRNFEDCWSEVILGAKVQGWDWCTMTTSHLIDTRPKYTGLKFQAFIHFGVEGYEDEIEPYLKTPEKGQEFNNIQNAPEEKLHLYCGIDTVCTRELKKVQKKYIKENKGIETARRFTMDGLELLASIQNNGILADRVYFEDQNQRLTKRLARISDKILRSNDVELFKRKTGKSFNFNSTEDLKMLFFDIKGHEIKKYTTDKETNASMDAEVLHGLTGEPIAEDILLWKKLSKIKGTYLAQFFREIDEDNRIHPIQNLHIADTHRSSQDHPNFQNIPVRDEEAKRTCRSGIVAVVDGRLVEIDFGSHEVRIIGCYTEDPVLIQYINDTTTDMHRDESEGIYILPRERISKDLRFYTKNCWVFPQFYRSYYVSCARDIWNKVVLPEIKTSDGESIREHLKSKGIYTQERFTDHLKKVEKIFWDKFRGVKRWQDKILKSYLELGYVHSFFGHRRTGFLTPNQVVNTPVQGTAFHCLLWSLSKAKKLLQEKRFRSRMVNQIHDSSVNEVYPSEQNQYIETIRYVSEDLIRETFKWIIVPLAIEVEMTPINGNWYQKEGVHLTPEGKWVSYNKDGTIKHIYDENY